MMEYLYIAIGILFLLVGIIGAIVPGIPGPAVSFVGMLITQLREVPPFDEETLVVFGLIAAAVTFLDYVVPVWGTKKFGGSKLGVRGSMIGLIVAIFVLPFMGIVLGPFGIIGILAGPFVGAYIGEKMAHKNNQVAIRSAIGSFLGFMAGTMMKLVYSIVVAVYFFKDNF